MTSDILAQELHNCITRSGYQIKVWWHGSCADYTSYKRANDELARLQRYEAPQQQALSLLETLYTQYDSMAEQYESLAAYIKTTFSLPQLNKVIDQLTADLMAVTQCHPQMVQQAQAQAVGATVADSVTLSEVTTEDEWPTVSIPMFPDDEDFCHPDSLGDLWQPQMVQQAQAQALGAAMESAIVESREVAGDSSLTPSAKSPAQYAEQYRRGLLTEQELLQLCPLAVPLVAKRTAWQSTDPHADYSSKIATDQFGTRYHRSANGEWESVTLIDGREGCGYEINDALRMALSSPIPAPDSRLTLGDFVEDECPCTAQGEKIAHTEGMSLGQHLQRLISDVDVQDELDHLGHPDSLGDLYEATNDPQKYRCQNCNGSGSLVHWHACPHCAEGQIITPKGPELTKDCPHCHTQWEIANYVDCPACRRRGWLTLEEIKANGFTVIRAWKPGMAYEAGRISTEEFIKLTGIPIPHNPPQFYPTEHIVTRRKKGYYTLQVPENHPLATFLEGFIMVRHAESLLIAAGYDVSALRPCLALPRPKVVKKQLRQAMTELQQELELLDDLELISDLVKKLEELL